MRPVFVMVLSALFALAIANNATQWSSDVRDICASNDINWAQRFALNTTRFVTCYKDQVFNVLDCPAGFIFDEDLQGCEPYAEANISSHLFAHIFISGWTASPGSRAPTQQLLPATLPPPFSCMCGPDQTTLDPTAAMQWRC